MKQENRIAEYRKLRELTQEELAEALGTTRAQIANLERGARALTLHWMRRLAGPLKCAPADLLVDDDAGVRLDERESALICLWRELPVDLRERFFRAAHAFSDTDLPSARA